MNELDRIDQNNDLGKGPKGTRKDRAILALLQYSTIEKAAAAVGIHPSTLYRWLKQPDFKQKLIEAQSAANLQLGVRWQQAAPAASHRLVRVMLKEDTPASSVIRACDSILKHAERSFERDVLEARIAKLEKAQRDAEAQQKS
jgi:transposase-like protein